MSVNLNDFYNKLTGWAWKKNRSMVEFWEAKLGI